MLHVLWNGFTVDEKVIQVDLKEAGEIGMKMSFISRWNVAGALHRPKGRTLNW